MRIGLVVMVILAVFAIGSIFVLNQVPQQSAQTPSSTALPKSQPIEIIGEMICLPHKDDSAFQTMECAFGLKSEDGTYYALSDTDETYKNVSQPTGEKYKAVGQFTPQDDFKYQSIGVILVESLTPVEQD